MYKFLSMASVLEVPLVECYQKMALGVLDLAITDSFQVLGNFPSFALAENNVRDYGEMRAYLKSNMKIFLGQLNQVILKRCQYSLIEDKERRVLSRIMGVFGQPDMLADNEAIRPDIHLNILGAGVFGQMLAQYCVSHGISFDMYDKRDSQSIGSRGQSAGWKHGNLALKMVLSDSVFERYLMSSKATANPDDWAKLEYSMRSVIGEFIDQSIDSLYQGGYQDQLHLNEDVGLRKDLLRSSNRNQMAIHAFGARTTDMISDIRFFEIPGLDSDCYWWLGARPDYDDPDLKDKNMSIKDMGAAGTEWCFELKLRCSDTRNLDRLSSGLTKGDLSDADKHNRLDQITRLRQDVLEGKSFIYVVQNAPISEVNRIRMEGCEGLMLSGTYQVQCKMTQSFCYKGENATEYFVGGDGANRPNPASVYGISFATISADVVGELAYVRGLLNSISHSPVYEPLWQLMDHYSEARFQFESVRQGFQTIVRNARSLPLDQLKMARESFIKGMGIDGG